MPRLFASPRGLAITLLLFSAIPILVAASELYQSLTGTLPPDAQKYTTVPVTHFLHALGGVLFGVLGPIQFAGVLRNRFGRLHRITGRVFVASGALLSLGALRLLWQFPDASTWVLVTARLLAGVAVGATLILAVRAIRHRDVAMHRAWMIRAYAIGMGSATVSLLMFPIYIVTGAPIHGYAADLVFVASWAINIGLAEWVIGRGSPARMARPKVAAE